MRTTNAGRQSEPKPGSKRSRLSRRWIALGVAALAALGVLALLTVTPDLAQASGGQPACTGAINGDHDRDNDGLIEICNLDQLHAIRFDSNGDGTPEGGVLGEYLSAFPGIAPDGPGCPTGCQGYELVVDLDFDTNGNSRADAGDKFWNGGLGWDPIRLLNSYFAATFEGNGNSISNLYMNKPQRRWDIGLFAKLDSGAVVRNLSVADARVLGGCDRVAVLAGTINGGALVRNVLVTGELRPWPNVGYDVGMITGLNHGRIEDASANGVVVAHYAIGIAVGKSDGVIIRSSASGTVTGVTDVGGLLGVQRRGGLVRSGTSDAVVTGTGNREEYTIGGLVGANMRGRIWASMARGTVSGPGADAGGLVGTNWSESSIVASYSSSQVNNTGERVGGLVGENRGLVRASYSSSRVSGGGGLIGVNKGGQVQHSYWDTDVSGAATSSGGVGQTTAMMLEPSSYTGIYAHWNVDLDGDGRPDDPWVFTSDGSDYPRLRLLRNTAGAARTGAILLTADAVPLQETADDLILDAIALPSGVTISPAFASSGASFTITLPPRMAEVTLYGRFKTMGDGNAWLAVAPNLSSFDILNVQSLSNHLLAQLSGDSDGSYKVELENGASKTLQAGVFKWKPDKVNQAPFSSNSLNRLYSITLTRANYPTDDASLSDLSVNPGRIDFSRNKLTYAIDVAATVNAVNVTPRTNDPQATVTVAGKSPLAPAAVRPGANTIDIVVTARDGTTTQTYQLTINRALDTKLRVKAVVGSLGDTADNMLITELGIPDGFTITPDFSSDHFEYEVSVPYLWTEIEVIGRFTTPFPTRPRDDRGCVTNAYIFASSSEEQAMEDFNDIENRSVNGWTISIIAAWHQPRPFGQRFELTPGQPTPVAMTLFRWKPCQAYRKPVEDNSLTKTYTFTLTRALPNGNNAPTVAAPIADVSSLQVDNEQQVSLAGVFTDPDAGDTLTIEATSSDTDVATVTVAADKSSLTLTGKKVGTATITVTADDGEYGVVTDTFTVTVVAQQSPPAATWIPDVSGLRVGEAEHVSLDGVFTDPDNDTLTIEAESSDTDIATVVVVPDQSRLVVTAKKVGTATITVTADDGKGGTVDQTFTVTVKANSPPTVASAIANLSGLRVDDTRQVGLSGVFTDADHDPPKITAESSDIDVATVTVATDQSSLTVTAKKVGTATITVTADDENGGTVDETFTVAIKANNAPTIASSIGDISGLRVDDTRNVSLAGVFTDADSDSLTLKAASDDTDVATVTVATDQSSLTVTAKKIGTATITVTADDGNGGTVDETFTATVKANAVPTIAASIADVGGLRVDDTRKVSLAGVFTDADSDSLTLEAASDDTDVATVTVATDQSSLTVTAKKIGTATITVTANDGNGGNVSDAFTVTIGANAVPTIASAIADVGGLRVDDTRKVSLTGVFTDADGDSLTLEASSSDTDVATVTVATDQSSLTVTAKKIGTATITVTADDGNGGTVDETFTATVKANSPPTVASAIADVGGLRADDTRTVSLAGVFTDADGDTLTITAESDDTAVATVTVAADQSSLTVTAKRNGTATITVAAADGRGASGIDNFTVTVSANAPAKRARTLDNVSGLRADDTRQVSLTGVFTDDDGDTLTLTAKSSDTAVATVSVATDGSSLTVTAKKVGTATITVTADDGKGGTATATFTVTVKANSAPTVSSAIADVSGVEPDDRRQVSLAGVFSDADGDTLTITAESSDTAVATVTVAADKSSLTVTTRKEGAATVTVTATDGRGGSVSDAFTATVSPSSNNAPTVASALGDQAQFRAGDSIQVSLAGVFEDADGDPLTLTASSSNDDIATASVSGETLTVSGRGGGTATITVTATDGKGGSVSDSFTVPVKRNAVPTTLASIPDVSGLAEQAEEQVSLQNAFRDAENDRLTITALSSNTAVAAVSVAADFSSLTLRGVSEGTATITVTADDGRGGQVSQTFTVSVEPEASQPEPEQTEEQAEVGASDSEPEEEQDVLVRFDANGDGVISGSEYRSALAYLGNGVTVADLMRLRQAWIDGGYQQ